MAIIPTVLVNPPPGSLNYPITLFAAGSGSFKGSFCVAASAFRPGAVSTPVVWQSRGVPISSVPYLALEIDGIKLGLENLSGAAGGITFSAGKNVLWISSTPISPPAAPGEGSPSYLEFVDGSTTYTLMLFYTSRIGFQDPRLGWSFQGGRTMIQGADIAITGPA